MSSPDSLFASWLAGHFCAKPVELVRAHPEQEAAFRELHQQWQHLVPESDRPTVVSDAEGVAGEE